MSYGSTEAKLFPQHSCGPLPHKRKGAHAFKRILSFARARGVLLSTLPPNYFYPFSSLKKKKIQKKRLYPPINNGIAFVTKTFRQKKKEERGICFPSKQESSISSPLPKPTTTPLEFLHTSANCKQGERERESAPVHKMQIFRSSPLSSKDGSLYQLCISRRRWV